MEWGGIGKYKWRSGKEQLREEWKEPVQGGVETNNWRRRKQEHLKQEWKETARDEE
jgi:hypothetical protein